MIISQKAIKTAGAYLVYQNRFAFMVGPDKTGEKLGIVRLGGHVEAGEDSISCARREIREEASVEIMIADSPATYYMRDWGTKTGQVIEGGLYQNPILICGNEERATVLFLAYTEEALIPATETQGILLLNEKEIQLLCGGEVTLCEYIAQGGQLLQNVEMDPNLKLQPGPHLKFLNQLIQEKNPVIRGFINRQL